MKKKHFTEEQIALALHQTERTSVEDITCHLGVSQATFYRWKSKYGDLLPSEVKRLKLIEEENRKLKQLVADLSWDKKMLQDVLSKKIKARRSTDHSC